MEFCLKKLSKQDGIREQDGILSQEVKEAGWNITNNVIFSNDGLCFGVIHSNLGNT